MSIPSSIPPAPPIDMSAVNQPLPPAPPAGPPPEVGSALGQPNQPATLPLAAPSPAVKSVAPTVQQPSPAPQPTTAARLKTHVGGLLHTIADSLGGPKTETEWGPQGENLGPKPVPTGQRVMGTIGRALAGAAAGAGAAQGPGGLGKAAAAGAKVGMQLNDEQTKNNMEMMKIHANTLLAYRHAQAEDRETMDKVGNDNAHFINDLRGDTRLRELANVPAADINNVLNGLVKTGYSAPQLAIFQSGSADAVKTKLNPQGIGGQESFSIFYPLDIKDKAFSSLKIPIGDETADALKIGKDQALPIWQIAKMSSDNLVLQQVIASSQRELTDARHEKGGWEVKPINPTTFEEKINANKYAIAWNHVHSADSDPRNDIVRLREGDPKLGILADPMAANWVENVLYGGHAGEVGQSIQNYREAEKKRIDAEAEEQKKKTEAADKEAAAEREAATPEGKAKAEKTQLELQEAKKRVEILNEEAKTKGPLAQTQLATAQAELKIKEAQARAQEPFPLANGKTGEAYIALLPPEDQSVIREIGQGHINLNRWDYLLTRNPRIPEELANAFPDFDSAKAAGYVQATKEFTSGPIAKSLNSAGAMFDHARQLYDHAGLTSLLGVAGGGTEEYRKYQADAAHLSEEAASFLKGGNAPTEIEIKQYKELINPTLPINRKAGIREVVKLLSEKYGEYKQQWDNAAPSVAYKRPMPSISQDALHNMAYVLTDSGKVSANTVPELNTQAPQHKYTAGSGAAWSDDGKTWFRPDGTPYK